MPATKRKMAETILAAVTDGRPVAPADPRLQPLLSRPAKALARSYDRALRLLAARKEARRDGA